jgi:hypothetical protein
MARIFKHALIAFGLIIDPADAFSAPSSKSPNLDLIIELKELPPIETVNREPLKFESTCNNFGSYLSKNRGLWGTGPFSSVKCIIGKSNQAASALDSSDADWRLQISAENEIKTFTFFFREPDNTLSKIASYSVKTGAGR